MCNAFQIAQVPQKQEHANSISWHISWPSKTNSLYGDELIESSFFGLLNCINKPEFKSLKFAIEHGVIGKTCACTSPTIWSSN